MKYRVTAIERFHMKTEYSEIEADGPEEAVAKARSGDQTYDRSEPVDVDDPWVETLSVVQSSETRPA